MQPPSSFPFCVSCHTSVNKLFCHTRTQDPRWASTFAVPAPHAPLYEPKARPTPAPLTSQTPSTKSDPQSTEAPRPPTALTAAPPLPAASPAPLPLPPASHTAGTAGTAGGRGPSSTAGVAGTAGTAGASQAAGSAGAGATGGPMGATGQQQQQQSATTPLAGKQLGDGVRLPGQQQPPKPPSNVRAVHASSAQTNVEHTAIEVAHPPCTCHGLAHVMVERAVLPTYHTSHMHTSPRYHQIHQRHAHTGTRALLGACADTHTHQQSHPRNTLTPQR